MEIDNYVVIDTTLNECVNIVVWDGVSLWAPPAGCIVQISDGTISIGERVVPSGSVWVASS